MPVLAIAAVAGRTARSRELRVDDQTVRSWFQRLRLEGRAEYRDIIIDSHHWLVRICARQMRRHDEPLDDLEQTGQLGLIRAVDRFDLDVGVQFRTYASATVLGELRRHYRSVWRLRTPRSVQELHLRVSRAREEMTRTLQRSPTVDEIADHLSVDRDLVIEAIGAGLNQVPDSLFGGPTGLDGPTDRSLGMEDDELGHVADRAAVRDLLATLPKQEATILYLRYFHDLTQSEIGSRMGLSQVHVSRLMRSGLARLRARADG
ncbi:MAG: sigma-70 family RNA polymerase sigma factor [Ilumatobacteraceae bacterium]